MGTESHAVIDLDEDRHTPVLGSTGSGTIVEEGATSVVDEDADLGDGIPARARRNGNGSITLPLRYPVTLTIKSATNGTRDETYAELTFHRLTGADLRAMDAASAQSKQVVFLARSTRIREAVMNVLFDKMDGGDLLDAGNVVGSFFPSGPKAGRFT
ncbi:MAG TPA: phage tail assembly protein [Kaistia sp.]|nr:phage tail assembly protein [Kaistia sp.]